MNSLQELQVDKIILIALTSGRLNCWWLQVWEK